jgi:hypothetical protein
MLRYSLALIVLLNCLSVVSAMFTPQASNLRQVKDLSSEFRQVARVPEQKRELVITAETQIQVNGRPCRLDEVPAGAEIILLDVGANSTVIRKIHFRTRN